MTENQDAGQNVGQSVQDNAGQNVETNVGQDKAWEQAVSMRQAGHSLREIETRTGIPRSTLHSRFREGPKSLPRREILENQEEDRLEIGPIRNQGFSSPGSIETLEEDRASIRKLVPEKFHGPLDAVFGIAARRQRSNNGHNGHAVLSYSTGDDRLKEAKARYYEALAETEEMESLEDRKERRFERRTKTETTAPNQTLGVKDVVELIKLFNPQKGNEQLTIKDALELAKFLGGSSTKETLQLVDYIQQAANKGQGVTLNDISLKLEELKETHDVEMAKLGFEEKKWEYQKSNEGKTIEQVKDLVKTVTEGPAGKFLESLGSGAADRIRGGPKVPMVDAVCPNCKNKMRVNAELSQIQCTTCGAVLRRAEPQPQQTEETQTQQEAKPQEPQTQEAKPLDPSKIGSREDPWT